MNYSVPGPPPNSGPALDTAGDDENARTRTIRSKWICI